MVQDCSLCAGPLLPSKKLAVQVANQGSSDPFNHFLDLTRENYPSNVDDFHSDDDGFHPFFSLLKPQ